jgi:hypothetical protein
MTDMSAVISLLWPWRAVLEVRQSYSILPRSYEITTLPSVAGDDILISR